MSEAVISKLKEENLCTHFILPLIKLNKFSFIPSNFVNCYINRSGTFIFVEVSDFLLVPRATKERHPAIIGFIKEERNLLVYQIPNTWHRDVHLFIEGKYSKMSKPAKHFIRKHSTLSYKKKLRGQPRVTDARLLALEKHPMLKEMWENTLSNNRSQVYLDEGAELLSIPGEGSFIELSDFKVETQL